MDKITQLASQCRIASSHDSVFKSECVYTFHNPYTRPTGIVVNLHTFIGTIDELAFQQQQQQESHDSRSDEGHGDHQEGIFLRIVMNRIPKKAKESEKKEGEKTTVTKLGLGIEGGFDNGEKFEMETQYSIVVLCQEKTGLSSAVKLLQQVEYSTGTATATGTADKLPLAVVQSVESILRHSGAAVQQDIKAFELDEEIPVSKYANTLEFVDNEVKISPNPRDWKCEKSGDVENLWLNLSTGFIGGGRRHWDGSGGSNGALDHYMETGEKYPLVVKLGTITKDIDTADCYSYAKDEDGPVRIPNLAQLLARRGIQVSSMEKTVKSTLELEVELNATYAFDAITESGAKLVPISGPKYQGLQNLGNSCYINSVVQMLFSGTVPELVSRYGTEAYGDIVHHPLLKVPPTVAPRDLLCQTAKIACALTSGVFSIPVEMLSQDNHDCSSSHPKYRIPPRMFKHVIGNDHADFCTGQQQDAAQFLQYLLEKLDRAELGSVAQGERLWNKVDANLGIPRTYELFAFKTTSRMVCTVDNKVKYKDDHHPETILSLRIPMEKSRPIVETKLDANDTSEPEEKRQRAEEDDDDEGKKKKEVVPTVTMQDCLDSWADVHTVDGVRWSHLNNNAATAMVETRFSNFPRYVIVQIQRYELGPDWTPRKLEVMIDVPEEIDLSSLRCKGPQVGEDIIVTSDDDNDDGKASGDDYVKDTSVTSPPMRIDEESLAQLMDMGFGMNGCIRALHAVGGSNVELAMNWIFEHNNDADFNDPLPTDTHNSSNNANSYSSSTGVDEEIVSSLVENLGCFTADQVRAALLECGGAADRAADWLFSHMDDLDNAIANLNNKKVVESGQGNGNHKDDDDNKNKFLLEDGEGKYRLVGLVSHIGKNTTSGHYVAHLKGHNNKWAIFNDENVAWSETPPTPHAYLYLFQRMDTIGSPNPSY
mmetsp:Transcript_558/g.975  ORF Transcript_558/g.975 Transcript_558/m.975 type:complete len:936 (+) Transcript_558:715-3522(+)|eukprot:CAMPEP_0176502022 /NCGR_PEP_ID=MMETSP0200_2-20121128/14515_1 /TAXON_ID=947934 /ORGANISM="Chaetoceros sp., Strain GSL56" /LENGTH=935 /DNA_ID=CAMNT_0017901033 /DNA_START=2147 /DNA_END=4954 /DNA_ORIENTATION=-